MSSLSFAVFKDITLPIGDVVNDGFVVVSVLYSLYATNFISKLFCIFKENS